MAAFKLNLGIGRTVADATYEAGYGSSRAVYEGVQHRLVLPGVIAENDKPAVLSAAQAFAFPSLYEGFGLPPLEAMACGRPVLASNVSSIPEILGDGAGRHSVDQRFSLLEHRRRLSHVAGCAADFAR